MKIVFAFLLLTAISVRAAIINASSGNSADVQTALNSAAAGDTVVIPPGGPWTWTSRVSRNVPANVTLKGQGTTATGGGDQTMIIDSVGVNSSTQLLNIGVPSTGVFRLTGISFQSGSLGGFFKDAGTVNFEGPGNIRIDHCHLNMADSGNYKQVRLGSGVFGVMDHCILELYSTNAIYLYNGRFGGSGDVQGNYEWTLPTNFGGSDYFYIEDNVINGYLTGGQTVYASRAYDMFTASKTVIRFNNVSQACLGETHATGHGPDDRGGRSQEVYGNLSTSALAADPNFTGIDIENGTSLVWGNNFGSGVYKSIYKFKLVRGAGPPSGSYTQSPPPTGWGYAGTQYSGTGSNWDGGTFNGTDTLRGYPCLDQPGRGPGDRLIGTMPSLVNQTSGTVKWPNQSLEPIYIWKNTGSINSGSWNGAEYSNTTDGRVLEGRDYYAQASGIQTSPTSPFNGTSGVGWGTLANRPTTCTTGVAYFATDQGSWNQSSSNPYGVQQSGADGVLYKATATNTWTAYYTPYTYPHPLQTASSDTTAPTPNPMTFASAPAAVDAFSVTMTATTASDASAVEYYFDETSGHAGGTDSGWQSSPTYVDTGLSPSTLYTYRVKARDSSLNENTYSSAANATTPAYPGGSIAIDTLNVTNLRVGQ